MADRNYVAIGKCGHVVAGCTANCSELPTFLREWAVEGWSIERMSNDELKAQFCTCEAKQKTLGMG